MMINKLASSLGKLTIVLSLAQSAIVFANPANDVFMHKQGLSHSSNGKATIDTAEKKNWTESEVGKTYSVFTRKVVDPTPLEQRTNDRQRVKIEYVDEKKHKLARITRVQDVNRNTLAYGQNLEVGTLKYENGVPSSFTNCQIDKSQDFREKGRTYVHEKASDAILGTLGSKSEVKVTVRCDRVDKTICNSLRVWSATEIESQLKQCYDSLGKLNLLFKRDEAGKIERIAAFNEFIKFNNETNPLINRDLSYKTEFLEDAYSSDEAQSGTIRAIYRLMRMTNACEAMGFPIEDKPARATGKTGASPGEK